MLQKKSTRILVTTILIFLLIYLISITNFIFAPVAAYLAAIAVPIIGAGLIFYITNPLVNLLEKYKVPRILGIIIVFLLILGLVFFGINFVAPIVQQQFIKLEKSLPNMVEAAEDLINLWKNRQSYFPKQLESTIQNITNNLSTYVENITGSLVDAIGQIFSFVFSFFLIPFFLFFMLKDGDKFIPFITQFLSDGKSASLKKLASNINHTLASFIQGQFIVSLCVGIMLYIGYIIIDLPYSLTLALFGVVMNLIPFVGPFLSAIPAVIVGFFQEPMLGIWAAVVMIIAQQVESNFISPNVMGKVLKIHPLTVITLILAAGGIAGFLGLLFIIPMYAVIKTIISHFYHEWRERQPADEKEII
ncbi:pheromone autoinducer 2 transporter [Paraliobacillus sp. PM-2]|uniref:AI-2E family transporter n=1 Tax=Paraliobacillus sp. PM-2 TaxID=1462524 RepID=UPI00061BA8E8|nr:AI-2E family transporter [Paraliobacillus sp. PM-2]CQR46111.1 pheromone autoinducer 2 transporter [Paraliobacillus sp. PM-2]